MEEILQIVKHVTVFVLVYRMILNLFSGSPYIRYLRMMEGMIIMLLILVPVLSWITGEKVFSGNLERNISETELEWEKKELEFIGEQRDAFIRQQVEKKEAEDEAG